MNPKTCRISLEGSDRPVRELRVELASNPLSRARGLMGRTSWGEIDGMLFVYPWPRKTGIWMAGTDLPLDAVFVDRTGLVVKMARDLKPNSKSVETSGVAIKWLLELPAGQCDEMGLRTGDRLRVPELAKVGFMAGLLLKWRERVMPNRKGTT